MGFTSKKYPFNVNFKQLFVKRLDSKGEPVTDKKGQTKLVAGKFSFDILTPVGKRADYEAHWKSEGLNPVTTLDGILNQDEKQSKEGFKSEVRDAVIAVESSLFTPKLTIQQLVAACRKDVDVRKALEDMQANVTANHIGQVRNKDVTKSMAAQVGVELLKQDAPRLKALAIELGIEIPTV